MRRAQRDALRRDRAFDGNRRREQRNARSQALLQRLAPLAAPATAAPCPPFERKCADDTEGGGTD